MIAFYLENQTEVDAYVAQCRAEIDRQATAPQPGPDRAELRRRMEARRPPQVTSSGGGGCILL